jgi:hypothetical protein
MKRAIGIFLAVMLLAVTVKVIADTRMHSIANITSGTSTGLAKVFALSNVTAVTQTASTYPSKVDVKKMWIPSITTTPVVMAFQLWDAPKGVTGAASARKILDVVIPANAYSAGPWMMNFEVQTGDGSDAKGLFFQYAPTIVETGTATITAYIEYDPLPVNKVIPQ